MNYTCCLCGKVGTKDEMIISVHQDKAYCRAMSECDIRRGVIASRKAKP